MPAIKVRSNGKPRHRLAGWRLFGASVGLFVLVFVGGLLWPITELPILRSDNGPGETPGVQVGRVVDGDTFELIGGERVRILNIDTAEMPPRSQCARERELALAAKARLAELIESGEIITLAREGRDRDQYDRQLRRVRIDGQDVGALLIREGLAQRWQGRKADWC
ncbi:thermonuclease family protein [Phenylobacterium terrae]|uniref:Thermonuclease family protein n=1 Tax=Phenylobacterium terrae TaxID=2665495 RepID=A0ABW4N6N5_9CAUL